MKKVLSIFILLITFATIVSADNPSLRLLPYDFKVDGLCYKIKSDGNSVKVTYKNYLISNYKNIRGELVIPERVEHDGKSYLVTEIGGSAFRGCSGMTSLEIPNSVTEIGGSAFSGCTGLTSVKIPNSVTSIGDNAFKGTAWYNNQPDGLIYIVGVAYKYKGEMPDGTSIVLKDGCTGLSGSAFKGCTGLTSVTIPNSVTAIGSSVFEDCTGLKSIVVEAGNPKYDSRNNCNAIIDAESNILIAGCMNTEIPNSVTKIDCNAFSGCTGLMSITIPNSVTEIGGYAFSGCTGLMSITIPNSVTDIGDFAFYGCTGLASITIPNSVTEIGSSAFFGCTGLTSITIPNSVTEIGYGAFEDCTGLTSVSIPNSVIKIDISAFKGCTGLTSLVIPNSVTEIGSYAFKGCTGLASVTISNLVTEIGSSAFSGCTGLASVTIPNSVTKIDCNAFSGCIGLTSVTIPNSVTEIGSSAFSGCTGLATVTIPNSVTEIGISAFEGCTSMVLLTIPNTVNSIGNKAFAGCIRLDSIVSEVIEPQFVVLGAKGDYDAAISVYNGIDLSRCILSVPEGTKHLYDQTFPWYAFDNISEQVGRHPFNNQITDVQKIQRYYESQQYTKVILLGEQLLQNPDFASNPDNVDVIIQLAESYYYMHRYSKAKDCYETAINIYSNSKNENRLKIAEMRENIGNCYFNLQEYDNAIESFMDASKIYEDKDKIAYLQEMIGRCNLNKNESNNAKNYFTNTFNSVMMLFYTKSLIQNRYDYYYDNKMYDEAINLCSQAQEKFGLYLDSLQSSLSMLSLLIPPPLSLSSSSSSSSLLMSSLLLPSLVLKNRSELSEMKGRCYYAKNDIDSAFIVFQEACSLISLSERSGFFSFLNRNIIDLKSQLDEDIALCYMSKGDYTSAYSYIRKSVEIRQKSTLEYFGVNTTAERAEYWDNQSYLFQNTYPALAFEVYNPGDTTRGQREMIGELYNKSALFSKGLLLTSENEFKNIILESKNENVKRLFYRLQELNIELNALKEQPSPEQGDIILQLEQETKRIEKELLTVSKKYRDFRGNLMITWDSVQAKLGDNDMAIEFLSFPKLGTDRVQYIALTVRKGDNYDQPHLIELCEESDLLAAAKQPYTSAALSDSIWGKLYRAGELNDVKNIFFSPCGELHKIGIESMPHWDGSGRLMSECGLNFYRLSSTRELAMNRTPIESSGAALFGGIYYDAEKTDHEKLGARYKGHEGMYATRGFDFGDVDLRGIGSDYLAASREEADSINHILGRKNVPVVYRTSGEATETSFKELSGQRKSIIHIATHGFFLTDSAARAEKANHKNGRAWITDDAMTHSGLLFAAAAITIKYHQEVSESWEDGVLTAYEVSQLNLRGLDLVVLSACQTGNGEISGEGVFGMQRGFKMAGAQSIIMSLWDVNDKATKDMMTQFYKYYLVDSLSKREAFLKAQEDVRNNDNNYTYDVEDPVNDARLRAIRPHWAAFILLDAI